MNYLITGGTGFLGSYICKQLLDEGHKVVCYDYAPSQNSIEQVLAPSELDEVTIVQGDVRDFIRLVHVCQDENINCIIHTAGLLLADSEKNIPAAVETNIMGTVNVFEAARICGIKRVVWSSSNSAFGSPDSFPYKHLPNDAPHFPITIYGRFKDFNEFLGDFYYERYGLEAIALRYVVIYGKARMRGGANWINALLNDPALGIPSEVPCGDDSPNLLYVVDAARATVLASQSQSLNRRAYTITGECKSMAEIRDYVISLIPEAQIKLLPGNMGIVWNFETSVEEEELGYKPEFNVERGARETINLLREEVGLPPV